MNAATLNQVAAILNATDKSAVITASIAVLLKSGFDIQQAMDAVCGEGSYMKFAGQVYEALRATLI